MLKPNLSVAFRFFALFFGTGTLTLYFAIWLFPNYIPGLWFGGSILVFTLLFYFATISEELSHSLTRNAVLLALEGVGTGFAASAIPFALNSRLCHNPQEALILFVIYGAACSSGFFLSYLVGTMQPEQHPRAWVVVLCSLAVAVSVTLSIIRPSTLQIFSAVGVLFGSVYLFVAIFLRRREEPKALSAALCTASMAMYFSVLIAAVVAVLVVIGGDGCDCDGCDCDCSGCDCDGCGGGKKEKKPKLEP